MTERFRCGTSRFFYCRKGGGSMAMITVGTSDDLREFIIRELKDGVVISVDLSSEEE